MTPNPIIRISEAMKSLGIERIFLSPADDLPEQRVNRIVNRPERAND